MGILMPDQFHHVQNFLTVGEIHDGELGQTTAMHIEQLGHGLFPSLGQTFLRRWHRTFLISPYGVAIAVRDTDGQLLGFLLGTTDQELFMNEVLGRHRGALAWRGAVGLARRPGLLTMFVRTRAGRYARKLGRRAKPDPMPTSPSVAVAVVHAVITFPGCRRQGVGRVLLSTFEQAVANTGTHVIHLVTRSQGGALEFYRALGWNETARRNDKDGMPIMQFDREVSSACMRPKPPST
jgi:ribosomal protein S18 acetylase RimI-like enzyme